MEKTVPGPWTVKSEREKCSVITAWMYGDDNAPELMESMVILVKVQERRYKIETRSKDG